MHNSRTLKLRWLNGIQSSFNSLFKIKKACLFLDNKKKVSYKVIFHSTVFTELANLLHFGIALNILESDLLF